jgi:hypothetical protein
MFLSLNQACTRVPSCVRFTLRKWHIVGGCIMSVSSTKNWACNWGVVFKSFLKVSGVGLKVRPDIFDVEITDVEQFCFKLI